MTNAYPGPEWTNLPRWGSLRSPQSTLFSSLPTARPPTQPIWCPKRLQRESIISQKEEENVISHLLNVMRSGVVGWDETNASSNQLLVELLHLLNLIKTAHEDTGSVMNVFRHDLEHSPHLAVDRLTTGYENV